MAADDNSPSEVELLQRRLKREKSARQQAETLLEQKSLELFERGEQLQAETAERLKAEKLADEVRMQAEHQASMQAASDRISAIVDTVPDGIITIGSQGEIETFNPAAEQLFGYRADDVIGKNVKTLMPEPYRKDHDNYLHNYLKTGEAKVIGVGREVQAVRADGSVFPMELSVGEFEISNQKYFAGVIRDISERKAAELAERNLNESLAEQFQQTRRALEELENTQDQLIQSEKMAALGGMVAGVAHEVNTPIGISVTAASHLQDSVAELLEAIGNNKLTKSRLDKFVEASSEAARIILANMARADELIQSFKQVAVDQTSDEMREFDMETFLHDVLLSLRPHYKKTQHKIDVDCEKNLRVRSYPGPLSQIVTNFLTNALMHGLQDDVPGLIKISARSDDKVCEFRMSDNGVGIPPEHIAKIQEPFFTTKRGQGGSGLGMHLVSNIVYQVLKGQLIINSELGQGTEFVVRFPTNVDWTS